MVRFTVDNRNRLIFYGNPVGYVKADMKKLRKRHSGEGYIDVCVLVVCAMLVLALAVRILPVFVAKQQLDTYAVELVCKP